MRMWVEISLFHLMQACIFCHPPREDVSWNTLYISNPCICIVILLVRMWVEIHKSLHVSHRNASSSSWGCELKYPLHLQSMYMYRHPPREDVSWNIVTPFYSFSITVILLVRMWVEITIAIIRDWYWIVILLVRMWVEMTRLDIKSSMKRSSSSWGCELKYECNIIFFFKVLSSSSWGCELKYLFWNRIDDLLPSSSSWGCELKCDSSDLIFWTLSSSSSWGCELKWSRRGKSQMLLRSSSSWGCELKC